MKTIRTVTNASREKEEYYEEDDSLLDQQERYYVEESFSETDRISHAVWGNSERHNDREGYISREQFKSVFQGNLPESEERIRRERQNKNSKERLAFDMVLSAPKSVSMALHLQGDLRVFDAQMDAVQQTVKAVEKELASARVQVDGVRKVIKTGNLISALLPHHTSRDGDMQLHTHTLIMNGTQCPDGQWRSLYHEPLVQARWIGSFYRQKLAENMQKLGYQIYNTKDGFELWGYSRKDLQAFSKRNSAIKEAVEAEGLPVTAQNKKEKVLATRKAKSKTGKSLEEKQVEWREEARLLGAGQPIVGSAIEVKEEVDAREVVESAIRHLSERSVSFDRNDIYATVLEHVSTKQRELEPIKEAINKNKNLVRLQNDRFTTVEALQTELETVKRWMAGWNKAEPLLKEPDLNDTLLKSGQSEAVKRTLTSTDRHQIIHGLSGVGKTKTLSVLKEQLDKTNVEVKGFAPTIDAAGELQKELVIRTNTVESLVLSQPKENPNQLWVIDEAGMVSARQMQAILRKAEAVDARILLVGDKGQNSSIEAGSPLRSLMAHGATTHKLSEIIRQQNSTQRQAVELIANGKGKEALNLLDKHGYVKEISDRQERTSEIAQKYLDLPQKEREKTLIVTGTNAERLAITQKIRDGLKTEEQIGESITAVQLKSRNLTKEQSRQVENYQVGNYIRLQRDYSKTPLQKGQLYKVEKIDTLSKKLVVSSSGGRIYRFDPSKQKDKEVFTSSAIEIAVGDRLRWTSTDKKQGQTNGKQFTVESFNETSMTVKNDQGNSQEVSLLQPLAVDYSVVSTSYRAQGKTAKRVIVSATDDPTSSQEPFYVKISRQTKELEVYTQDKEELQRWVERSNAKINPSELIGEIDVPRSSNGENESVRAEARATRSSESGTTRAKQGVQTGKLGVVEHNTLSDSRSPERVYPAVDRDASEPQAERDSRSNPKLSGADGSAESQYQRQHRDELKDRQPYQDGNSEHSRLQARVNCHRADAITQRLERSQEQFRHNISQLAEAIAAFQEEQVESDLKTLAAVGDELTLEQSAPAQIADLVEDHALDELTESISSVADAALVLESELDTTLKLENVNHLSEAIAQWQMGQELAEAILNPIEDSSLMLVSELAKQLQSFERVSPDVKSLLDGLDEQKKLTKTIVEVTEVVNAYAPKPFEHQPDRQPPQLNREALSNLAAAVANYQDEESLSEVKPFSGMLEELQAESEVNSLAGAIVSLQEEQLGDHLETSIKSFAATIEELQTKAAERAESIQKLAEAVLAEQVEQAIASTLDSFAELSELTKELVNHQPERQQLQGLIESLQEIGSAKGAFREQLQRLVSANGSDSKVFWQPEYPDEPPPGIRDKHWEEFKQSAIHPGLIALNAESIRDREVYDRLLSEKFTQSKYGVGQYVTTPMAREMKKYEEMAEAGGWWGKAGIDAQSLTSIEAGEKPKESLWGCYKPDKPRVDQQKSQSKGKTAYRKYENPASTGREPFLPLVPDELAERIYQKHGVTPTEKERQSGFWYVVKQHPEIPITITEGFKKTLSSISQGEVTIGLTGVNHIYRSKDELGNKLPQRQLNEEVAIFAQAGREFRFAYDQDTKVKTIVNVRRDLVRGIELLEARGSTVKVVKWNSEDGKGLDDLIANQEPAAYSKAQQQAESGDKEKRTHYRTEYNKLARKVESELGTTTPERLDLEIYTRAALKGELADGARVVGESDTARSIKSEGKNVVYIEAIEKTAGIYIRVANNSTADLDKLAQRLIEQQLLKEELEEIKSQTAKRGLTR